MHYHDPARPRSAGGLPQFIHHGWGIIPALELRFSEEDGADYVEVSGWFLTTPTSASRKSVVLRLGEFPGWIALWLRDPDTTATAWFKYSGPRAAEPIPAPSGGAGISLEDLDL